MAIFLAGKAVCYRILAFFCYGKLHFKCESADLLHTNQTQPKYIQYTHFQQFLFSFIVQMNCIFYKFDFLDTQIYPNLPDWRIVRHKAGGSPFTQE